MEVEPPSPEGEGAGGEDCSSGVGVSAEGGVRGGALGEGDGAGAPYLDNVRKKYLGRREYGRKGAQLSREDRDEWVRQVDYWFGRRSAEELTSCGEGFATFGCSGDPEHPKVRKHLGCKRAYCPTCGPKMEARRASEAWDHLKGYDLFYWMITATVPGTSREKVLGTKNWDGKVAKAIHRAVERTMGGRWGSLYSQHRFSSREPWKPNPHVHVKGPRWYLTKKGKGVCGRFDIPALRRAYGDELRKAFGIESVDIATVDGLPVLYVELRSGGQVRRHTLPYMVRGPIDWRRFGGFREGGKRVVYGGRVLGTSEFRRVLGMYEHGRHRVRYLGYLHARVRVKVAGAFGVDAGVSHPWGCATCGAQMQVEEVHRPGWDWVRGESVSDYESDPYYQRDKQERDRRRAEKEVSLGDKDLPEWV